MGRGVVILGHVVFVLPYVFLSLGDPFRKWDTRHATIAAALGAPPRRTCGAIRLPMLLAPVLTAAAVGFGVSVGQYLPTLLIGGGRVQTLTTEAVALASGGNRGYELASGVYPEITVAAEARPFAAESHLGRGLFLDASFAHSVGLASETASGGTMVETTNFVRFSAGAGFLFPIDSVVELGVAFGGGYDGYHLGTNVVLPTAEYGWLRPGARARFRFLNDETLVRDAGVGYRAVLGVGELATSFGEQVDAHGFDIGVGLGGNLITALDLGLTWGVRFDYVGYWMSFAGAAADEAATSGVESSVRFTFVAGWSFR